MKLRQLGFVFKETLRGIRENTLMSAASVTTITVSLTLLALFLLVVLNLQYLTVVVESQVELVAFLQDSFVRDEWQQLLIDKIRAVPGVTQVQFVSREEALEDLKEQFGERSDLLATMDGDANPLRDSLRIRAESPTQIPMIAEEVLRLDSVSEVKFGTDVVDRIIQISEMLRRGGLVLIGVMVVTTILLVDNTTRLTVFARRQEIQIMKLVGATNAIIRWPFLLEGVFLGALGALLAASITWYAYTLASAEISYALPFFPLLPYQPMLTNMTKLLLGTGVLLGGLGSTLSVRRYLSV
jgi:cell division transport system permease protein